MDKEALSMAAFPPEDNIYKSIAENSTALPNKDKDPDEHFFEQLANFRNNNLISNGTYLSQLGLTNYSAAIEESLQEDGGCLLLTEEEHAFRNAKKQAFELIESKDPINSQEFFDLIDLIVDFELKHNLKPIFKLQEEN